MRPLEASEPRHRRRPFPQLRVFLSLSFVSHREIAMLERSRERQGFIRERASD